MPRFTRTQLLDRALAALDETATEADTGPIPHTKALAFTFAYLTDAAFDDALIADIRRAQPKAYFTAPQLDAFTMLWKTLAEPLRDNGGALDFGRVQTIDNLTGYIFRMFGRVRG